MSQQILIIDDNTLNRDVLTVLLREQGIGYVSLASSIPLLDTLDQMDQLDAVFLDLEMPGMNGYETLALLKAHPISMNVPVVAYTVHVNQIHEAKRAGFSGFLSKPIDSKRFMEFLQRILDGQAVWEI
jgi:CheY-like chemotaxis protein